MNTSHAIRRCFACAAIILPLLAAVALPRLAAAQTLTLKAADVNPAGYPNVVALESMGKKLEAATHGRITLKMFPGGVLGSEKEMLEQAQVGGLQIARVSLGVLGPLVPEVNVFNLPFVFRDEQHMRQVIDGPVGDELLEAVSKSPARLVGLGWMDSGTRNLYTKRPVRSTDDLKGQKIRMMGNPLFIETMNAMGGNGIAMGAGEVFSALQTGVIDGAENNPAVFFTSRQYNAGPRYYSLTRHLIIPEIFVMSKVTWDKLSPADQVLLKKLAREAQLEQRALWDRNMADYVARLKEAGVEFIDLDTTPFFEATAPVRAKYGAQFDRLLKRIADVR